MIVEPMAGPECGDVGCFGERGGGPLAAVASGESVVASSGVKDVGQCADVILPAAVGANGWPEPDQVDRA